MDLTIPQHGTVFFILLPPPPRSTLFPYTTLFRSCAHGGKCSAGGGPHQANDCIDRKSTRLNSSHVAISYAVFCLKKKKMYYTMSQPRPASWILPLIPFHFTFVNNIKLDPFEHSVA